MDAIISQSAKKQNINMTLIEAGQTTDQIIESTGFQAQTTEIQIRKHVLTPEDISHLTPMELLEQNIRTERDEDILLKEICIEKKPLSTKYMPKN